MDTTNEMNQHELVNEVELSVQPEVIDEKELEKRAIDTITTLVNQANIISTENIPVDEMILYEDVDDPKTYIGKIEEHESKAKENYTELEKMKKAHFWTIGRNKAKVEQTQIVLEDIIKAINNNANATKALFNKYAKLAEYSNILYGIGIMGIASNRIVVREIMKRLEHASQEELNELARHELESVVYELQQQQRLERKVDENHLYVLKELESANNKVNKNRDYSEKKFEEVKDELASFEKQSQASIENLEKSNKAFHSEMQNLFSKKSEDLDKELKRMEEIHDSFKKDLNKTLDEKIQGLTNLHKQFVIDQTSTIDKLEGQIKNYKIVAILAGIISIASLIMVLF
ncbi:hypothetical protein [Pseudobutyrivibrio sp.]|jgi:CRISPR/Cas system CSM-associated protein Csm2 small subunit|uniref:hypothetical protein n=1 Tax=Pseudobutyrivibrio sp. TaxID=2014367 RepID=UPI0025F242DF|nr:hypothetical protein [Pseudobutyrivibrio sp.]